MSSEALERAQEISVVLDDVCGAAVASDTRVHLARAALDTLLAEVARLEQERDEWQASYRLQAKMTNDAGDAALAAEAALAVAREREQRLREALEQIASEAAASWIADIARAALVDEPAAATLAEPETPTTTRTTESASSVSQSQESARAPIGSGSASAAADEPGETP